MTIVVGVSTPEGLVLAADSRTTTTTVVEGAPQPRIGSDNAQKVFQVGEMGVATYGTAFLSGDTIAGVMDEFAAQVGEDGAEIEKFADTVGTFFDKRYTDHMQAIGEDIDPNRIALGFLTAGYDSAGVGHIKEVSIPGGAISSYEATTNAGGMMWRGQTEVVGRMLKGVDWPGVAELGIALDGPTAAALQRLEYIELEPIALQDGIDFASFLVRTTVEMQRFSNGTLGSPGGLRGCGGPTQLLAIERRGSTWIEELRIRPPSRPGLAAGAQR
jgi:hypothetical protein